jgi:hypothetical protein
MTRRRSSVARATRVAPLTAGALLLAVLVLPALALPRTAGAQLLNGVQLHGFGGWGYDRTGNENNYLSGDNEGSYADAQFSLIATAVVNTRLRVVAQAFWVVGPSPVATLDLAFAEWTWSDALRARVGLVRQPFGLYTEIHDVGTLRPFFDLPQGVYGPSGFVGESFRGASLSGTKYSRSRWGLSYDAYVGALDVDASLAPLDFLTSGDSGLEDSQQLRTRDVVGGRLVVHTPIDGLNVGASGYAGVLFDDTTSRRHQVLAASVEYLSDRWWVRSEYLQGSGYWRESHRDRVDGSYVEVAYRVTRHWQAAVLYDEEHTHLPGVNVSLAPSLLRHEDRAIGVNYWFDPNFVIKLSYHVVDGNRFAGPDAAELGPMVTSGQLRDVTRLVQIGSQFSF